MAHFIKAALTTREYFPEQVGFDNFYSAVHPAILAELGRIKARSPGLAGRIASRLFCKGVIDAHEKACLTGEWKFVPDFSPH